MGWRGLCCAGTAVNVGHQIVLEVDLIVTTRNNPKNAIDRNNNGKIKSKEFLSFLINNADL